MALRRIYNGASLVLAPPASMSVGSTNPSYKLDVQETNTNDYLARISNTNDGGSAGGLLLQSEGGGNTLLVDASSYGTALRVEQTGLGDSVLVSGKTTLSGIVELPVSSGTTPGLDGLTPVVVPCPVATANSKVFFSLSSASGTLGVPRVSSVNPGVSFSVVSTQAGDNSLFDYLVIG